MSELKLPAASGGGSISIKGPASSGSDVDLLDTSGNIKLLDGQEIRFGTDNDLALSHDGSNSYFVNKTGSFHLYPKAGEAGLVSVPDGTTKIYYDGSKKLETTSTGINITGGIRLGGNNAVNEIDDYEIGTFTPRLGGASNIGTYNITGVGQYIKIGGICHVNLHFYNKDLDNNASGGVWIDQLPFTSYNANSMVAGITTDFHTEKVDFDETQRYSFYCSGNTTKWKGLYSVSNSGWSSWSVSDFDTAAMYMELAGSYRTA